MQLVHSRNAAVCARSGCSGAARGSARRRRQRGARVGDRRTRARPGRSCSRATGRSSTRGRSTRSRSRARRATSRAASPATTAWRWLPAGDRIAFWSGRSGHGPRLSRARRRIAPAPRRRRARSRATRGSGGALVVLGRRRSASTRGRTTRPRPTSSTRGAPRRAGCRRVAGIARAVARRNARRLRGQRQDDRVRPRRARALHAPGDQRRVVEPRLAHERASDRRERTAQAARPSSSTRPAACARASPACRSAFSPDGRWLVLKRGTVRSGSPVPERFHAPSRLLPRAGPAAALSFTPDSRFVSTESRRLAACSFRSRAGRAAARPRLRHRRLVAGRPPRVRGLPGGVREREASGRHGSRLRDRHARPQSARRRAVPVRRSQLQRAALAAGRSQRALPHGHDVRRQRSLRSARGRWRHTSARPRPAQPRDADLVAGRHAHRGERAELHLSPRSGPAEPHRDRRAGRLGCAARDRRRRPAARQLRPVPVVQPGREPDRVRARLVRLGLDPDHRCPGRR